MTQQEFRLPEGIILISKTDLKGRISYCNPGFVEASGFTEDELLGQPHNIVRHPDMPEAAFADLWATIKQGLQWSAVVKNRRKNGDHYWVVAKRHTDDRPWCGDRLFVGAYGAVACPDRCGRPA